MSGPALTKLLVSPFEAVDKLSAQITAGHQILQSLEPPQGGLLGFGFDLNQAFEQAQAKQVKWAKYTIHLLKALFSDVSISNEFGVWWIAYSPDEVKIEEFERWMKRQIRCLESIVERLPLFPVAEKPVQAEAAPVQPKRHSKDIFIVHGHDSAAKEEVARFIERLGLCPTILHEHPDKGQTIIEKFEEHSDVGFAIVLLTPDDLGHPKDRPAEAKTRPRQNVVLELGFFIGKLGRNRVCALRKGEIEIPSDYSGILYKSMDDQGGWKLELAKEIKHAGIEVDLNRALYARHDWAACASTLRAPARDARGEGRGCLLRKTSFCIHCSSLPSDGPLKPSPLPHAGPHAGPLRFAHPNPRMGRLARRLGIIGNPSRLPVEALPRPAAYAKDTSYPLQGTADRRPQASRWPLA